MYGIEAILPLKIQTPSLCVTIQEGLSKDDNHELRLVELESVDKKRLLVQ